MKRITKISPAYDKRTENPETNYGIHGVEVNFVLKGNLGATQFQVMTNRQLPHVQAELVRKLPDSISEADREFLRQYSGDFTDPVKEIIEFSRFCDKLSLDSYRCILKPMGGVVGYHSPKPMYDGQDPMRTMLTRPHFDPETETFTPSVYGDPIICEFLDNDVPCYFDCSGLAGSDLMQTFLLEGEEAMWSVLQQRYDDTFYQDLNASEKKAEVLTCLANHPTASNKEIVTELEKQGIKVSTSYVGSIRRKG